jgi:hypothetical protein
MKYEQTKCLDDHLSTKLSTLYFERRIHATVFMWVGLRCVTSVLGYNEQRGRIQ